MNKKLMEIILGSTDGEPPYDGWVRFNSVQIIPIALSAKDPPHSYKMRCLLGKDCIYEITLDAPIFGGKLTLSAVKGEFHFFLGET